jgi:hypothetical protein
VWQSLKGLRLESCCLHFSSRPIWNKILDLRSGVLLNIALSQKQRSFLSFPLALIG